MSNDEVLAQAPLMYEAVPEGSHIRSAVNALALERLGLDRQNQGLLTQAQNEYGRTLMKVREALGDPVESRKDQILVTISLLCYFEVCASNLTPTIVASKFNQRYIVFAFSHGECAFYPYPRRCDPFSPQT